MKRWLFRAAVVFALGVTGSSASVRAQAPAELNAESLKGIAIRSIGPGLVTGRIADPLGRQ